MNYRHAFHAGSFADVVKHAVLARILTHLRAKPAAFRVLDTHAGAGRYDLAGAEASRSPEWREGIARLLAAPALALDGWTALNAYVPPKERRGLVLIDPPFEDEGDFSRLAQGLESAHRKWPGGSYLLWYPIKERAAPDALARRLRRAGIAKILRAELSIAASPGSNRLGACGLIVVNPPWTLERELDVLLPALQTILAGKGGGHRVDWLASES
jgi:23S rRNA (adenine2030-N6)-methyltransferase